MTPVQLPEVPESAWLHEIPVDAPLYTAAQLREYATEAASAHAQQFRPAVLAWIGLLHDMEAVAQSHYLENIREQLREAQRLLALIGPSETNSER